MKKCFKCGKILPLSEFHKSKVMKDGHLNKCKRCACLDSKQHRINNPKYYEQYENNRKHNPKRKQLLRDISKRCAKLWPERKAARQKVSNAIRAGIMIRPTHCTLCGKKCKPEAHHDNYKNPLSVVFLCNNCHKNLHAIKEKEEEC